MTKPTKIVLFDLDGTLIHTLPEIADSSNEALGSLINDEPLSHALIQSWIGNGAKNLFKLALRECGIKESALQDEFDERWPLFRSAYAKRCGTNSEPYPGVISCLDKFRQAGIRMAIVTNKEGHFAQKVINNHKLEDYFEFMIAGDTLATKKPDPQVLWSALEQAGVERSECLFIGDSLVDMETGVAAGVPTWAVTHGYHNGSFDKVIPENMQPDRFFSHFDELTAFLI